VWVDAGDDANAERILSRGARKPDEGSAEGGGGDGLLRGMERAFDPDPGGDVRMLVVAGRRFGGGSAADEAAWALFRLGVGAVVAESFGEGAERALAHAGVLALRFMEARTRAQLSPGDEIEIPNLPEIIEPGRPLVVRNLTRGLQHVVRHGLDARDIAVWRAGGILAPGRPGEGR
jgi:aconitate hydratase